LDVFDSIPKELDFLPSGLNESETCKTQKKRSKSKEKSDSDANSSDSGIPSPPKISKMKKNRTNSLNSSNATSPVKDPKQINHKSSKSSIKITKKVKNSSENGSSSIIADNSALTSFSALHQEEDDLSEISLSELFKLARDGKFKKKLFIFKDMRKMYSERLHFYESNRIFECSFAEAKKKSITFKCKFCKTIKNVNFGAIQNLTSHLTGHPDFVSKWLTPFEEQSVKGKKLIEDDTFNLVRAFISANLPFAILENEHFALCLKMQLASVKTFRNSILPRVYQLMVNSD